MPHPAAAPRRRLARLVERPDPRRWGWPALPPATPDEHHLLRRSAVLVLAAPSGDEDLAFLLVRRSRRMRHHPGELAFPGGGIDPGEDPVDAALRECREETGMILPRQLVLGTLPALHVRVSGNVVTPVLAWSPHEAREHRPAAARDLESDAVGWVRRRRLVDPERRVTVCDGEGFTGPGFLTGGGVIWGFTGNVLHWILQETGWERPWDATRTHRLSG